MNETTLGQILTGSSFWFGNYEFIKLEDVGDKDSLLFCQIAKEEAFVYISNCAWVKYKAN